MDKILDYNLFFWRASFGNTGTLNDVRVLSISQLRDMMVCGELHRLEEESGVVLFQIGKDSSWIGSDRIGYGMPIH
jgi:hypothetical protein